jgi:hypothetical protein
MFLFFGSNGGWTQDLTLARQVLYHLSHAPIPLLALVIWGIASHIFVLAILHCEPPIYNFHVAGITGVHHHTQPLVELGSASLLAQGRLELLQICISWIAGSQMWDTEPGLGSGLSTQFIWTPDQRFLIQRAYKEASHWISLTLEMYCFLQLWMQPIKYSGISCTQDFGTKKKHGYFHNTWESLQITQNSIHAYCYFKIAIIFI